MKRLLLLLVLCSNLCANDDCCYPFLPLYKASIGPEFYHVKRTREGGASQKGWLYGVRGSFERIGRYKWYLGVEGLWGKGRINGHSGAGFKLKSDLTDGFIEGRVGYTVQAKWNLVPSLTPFVGYGYMEEQNHYRSPSPLRVKFINQAPYVSYGFLSSMTFCQLTVGFNLKIRTPLDPVCKVRHDPVFGRLKMHITERNQYRLELPFYYDTYRTCVNYELGLVPFYEFRHYGRRENFPFDFLDTKLRIYGINVQFTCRF